MSKKYIYFAKKRNSHSSMEASTMCKFAGSSNAYTTCKTCLRTAGSTRAKCVQINLSRTYKTKKSQNLI